MIGRSFEVYFRLLALLALTFELYLRRQLFPRLTVAFHDLLLLLYLERYLNRSQSSRTKTSKLHSQPTCELLQLLPRLTVAYHDLLWLSAIYCGFSTTYCGSFTSSATSTDNNYYDLRYTCSRAYD
jgi:hypothetical protein